MAIGYDDEFDYLSEEEDDSVAESFAPKIKGASDSSLMSEETDAEPTPEPEKIKEEIKVEKPKREFESQIYIVKVTTNKEDKALEMIADKVNKKKIGIYAIARPHGLRGYIFLEAPDHKHAEDAVFNLPYVKGIIGETVTYDKVKQMLEPVTADIKIEKNDIIEIISEPFKNEKAKVVRVDKPKNECVVSLLGAAVPIPVTVKLDNIRVIRREELEEE
ncbi:transcription elongation factor Spt5 [archaeon]|jgi:transcription termination/antitermination protein NusG|nr:transcription elongation factor Spt5 [archaeon]MBT7128867.1 transcription elongation factor Spt5 [archaeon]